MPVFVWRGPNVLKDYASGMVVLSAASVAAAWQQLARHNAAAYWQLKTGRGISVGGGIDTDEAKSAIEFDEREAGGIDNPENGFPIEPVAFEADNLEPLVIWGGG